MNTTEKKKHKREESEKEASGPKGQVKDMAKKDGSKIKSADSNKQRGKTKALQERGDDSKAQIETAVKKAESKIKTDDPSKQFEKLLKLLKKKDKEEIIRGALEKYHNLEELKPYQAELIKMQRHLENKIGRAHV